MSLFEHFAIAVDLQEPPHRILMVARGDYTDHAIVFADPQKLRPAIDALHVGESESYLASKRSAALDGFMDAARGAHNCSIPGPKENPLPVAIVNHVSGAQPLAFTDGLARTALLIELGASVVPLQAPPLEARSLHCLFGGKRPVEPVSVFVVGDDRRRELISSYRSD